jgi:hypothetical protein
MRKGSIQSSWHEWLGLEPTSSDTINLDKWLKPNQWRNTGLDAPFMWGEVRTRGSLHYKVAIDKARQTHTCTCTQRDKICAHKLALVAGWADQLFTLEEQFSRPSWVEERLNTLTIEGSVLDDSKSILANKRKIPVARMQEMTNGYAFLEKWLEDQTLAGWRQILSPPADQVEEAALRLVNYRLSGPAKRLRNLSLPVAPGESQVGRLLTTLSCLYLACRSFARYDQLDLSRQEHLLQFSGITIRKDQVIANNSEVTDEWIVLAVQELKEDDLRSRQTWFFGQSSRRFALNLVYAWKKEPLPTPLTVGKLWAGSVYFYPGTDNFRIQLGEGQLGTTPFAIDVMYGTWKEVFLEHAAYKLIDPWTERLPVWIQGVRLVESSGLYFIIDLDEHGVPALMDQKLALQILSLQSTSSLCLFGLLIGSAFAPISIVMENTILQLS